MTPLSTLFGRELRRRRDARGWSQERLAGAAEINRSFLGEVERGEVVPSLETLGKLAGAFEVSVSELLAGVGDGVGTAPTATLSAKKNADWWR